MPDLQGCTRRARELSASKVRADTFSRTYLADSTHVFPQVTCHISLTYLFSQNQETS